MGEEVAIPLVLVDEESREILQRVVDKTAMLVNLNIKVNIFLRRGDKRRDLDYYKWKIGGIRTSWRKNPQ